MSKKSPIKGAGILIVLSQSVRHPIKSFNRLGTNTKLASVLTVVLVLVGLWSMLFNRNPATLLTESAQQQEITIADNTPSITATLQEKEGVVEQRNELGEWSDVATASTFTTGTGIRTVGAASRAIVKLEDGSEVRLDANTEMVFESLTSSRIVIDQKDGYIYNRVVTTNDRTYIVQTENARFQAQGTAFRTIASGDEEAVEVYQSSVKETDDNKTAKEGEKLTAKSAVNPDKDGLIEKLDIELLKKDPFIVWNRELDQKDEKFKSQLGFLKDFDGPKIEITEPVAGSTLTIPNESPQGSVTIKGKTDKGSKLTVQVKSIGGSSPVDVPVGEDGIFDSGILTAPIGTAVFELVATDPVGNKTTITVSYVLKRPSTVQEQGIILEVTQEDTKLKFSWGLVGISTPNGVKIFYGKNADPSDELQTVATGTSVEIPLSSKFKKGDTYQFKACRYLASTDTCDNDSNIVRIEIK